MTKIKLVLEYQFKCTPTSLYRALSTANGLSEWFADSVVVTEDRYTFYWSKIPQVAHLIYRKDNKLVRFRWEDDSNYYFEFAISNQELTGDISLTITDFIEQYDSEDAANLWNLQIRKLKRSIGCTKK